MGHWRPGERTSPRGVTLMELCVFGAHTAVPGWSTGYCGCGCGRAGQGRTQPASRLARAKRGCGGCSSLSPCRVPLVPRGRASRRWMAGRGAPRRTAQHPGSSHRRTCMRQMSVVISRSEWASRLPGNCDTSCPVRALDSRGERARSPPLRSKRAYITLGMSWRYYQLET